MLAEQTGRTFDKIVYKSTHCWNALLVEKNRQYIRQYSVEINALSVCTADRTNWQDIPKCSVKNKVLLKYTSILKN